MGKKEQEEGLYPDRVEVEISTEQLEGDPDRDLIKAKASSLVEIAPGKLKVGLSTKALILIQLSSYLILEEVPKEAREEIQKAIDLLDKGLKRIQVGKKKGLASVSYEVNEGTSPESMREVLSSPYISAVVGLLCGIKPKDPDLIKQLGTHLQPVSGLKTIAKFTGRERAKPSLFISEDEAKEIGERDKLSTKSGHLMLYLLQKYQEEEGEIVLRNLTEVAREVGLSTGQEVKALLELLGGYAYPFVERNEEGFAIKRRLLFEVDIQYSRKVLAKYPDIESYNTASKISILKNEPIDYIRIKPHPKLVEGLDSKDNRKLAYRVVSNRLLPFVQDLSELAYKLLCYLLSNKFKEQTITGAKLEDKLGLEERSRKAGRAGSRTLIHSAYQELQDRGHLESWSYEEAKDMYRSRDSQLIRKG